MILSRLMALAAILFALNFGYSFSRPLAGTLLSAYESPNWPQTQGTVMRAEVKQDRKGRRYALVEYAYALRGEAYESSRISFMGLDDGAASAQEVVARYAPGQGVMVFFNPDAPQESVLRPGLHSYIPVLIIAVGLLVVGSTLLYMVPLLLRARRPIDAKPAPDLAD